MKEYIRAMTKANEMLLSGSLGDDETNRFSKSDYRWADNKKRAFQSRNIRKGEVYQFEFGKNFSPEMSYEHRGLIIGVNEKLLYVLPIYSFEPTKHSVYHPQNNPKSNLYLLRKTDFSFIQRDSVMKLNDIRTVSVNRILYHHKDGQIDITSDDFKLIERLVHNKYFPSLSYEYKRVLEDNDKLQKKITDQGTQIQKLKEALQ